MSLYLSRITDRMNLHIEEFRSTILIQQKWKYNWKKLAGTTDWTYRQKKKFHHKTDNLVWQIWGGHFKLRTKGSSRFAKKYKNKNLTVNFDIKWVLKDEHWNVNVTKIPNGDFKTSSVSWNSKKIEFDTEDTKIVKRSSGGVEFKQYPIIHEFGHAVGNSIYASTGMHGDEYKTTSTHNSDKKSMMNIGNELRKRHIDYLISELNQMIKNTTFYAYKIK